MGAAPRRNGPPGSARAADRGGQWETEVEELDEEEV